MNKNGGKRIKMSLYTVGTLFRKGRKKNTKMQKTVDCNQVDRFIFYRNLPDFLVKKTLHKQLTFDKKYVCFKITNSARYEWGSWYGKRKERETDT